MERSCWRNVMLDRKKKQKIRIKGIVLMYTVSELNSPKRRDDGSFRSCMPSRHLGPKILITKYATKHIMFNKNNDRRRTISVYLFIYFIYIFFLLLMVMVREKDRQQRWEEN